MITTQRLSSDQITQYGNDGYTLFHQPVLAPEKFARLQAIFEENLARYGEDDLDRIHLRDERLLEFLLSDEVLDLVEPLIGPNIGLWSSHFISKPAGVGKATPWHEDSAYWQGRISSLDGIATIWLALDKVDAGNGAMQVIPGTHTNGFSEYEAIDPQSNIFGSVIKAGQFDTSKAVTFELEPNECSIHDARIIHGADANTSQRRRAGYTMRYFDLSLKINPERNTDSKFWLARGKNVGNNPLENGS